MTGKWSKMDWCRLSGGLVVPINYLSERDILSVVLLFFFNLPYHALNLISFYIVALSCTVVCIVGFQIFFYIPIVFILRKSTIVCCIEYLSEFK